MTDIRVITNNHPRDIVDAWELTPAEREEFLSALVVRIVDDGERVIVGLVLS